jgi:uncharacterized protein
VLVTFRPDAHRTLLDLARAQEELSRIFGRKVDLVERPGIERSRNPIRREAILPSARPISVAG